MKRFALTTFLAWLVFLMIDFLAHAVFLNSFWAQDYQAIKAKDELFRLIPFGYLSFLILIVMFGWVYSRLFRTNGNTKKGLVFGAFAGGLFALANFFGWYSFLELPPLFLLLVSFGYFVEIMVVGSVFGYLLHPTSIKKRIWIMIGIILGGLVFGIVLQNLLS
jgi:hypothetical protein